MKRIALFITLTLSASAQPEWTHRAWEGEFWGEPARLEEWWGDHGYLRNVRLLHFPFSEWSVLEANGGAYEIDCNGRKRVLDDPAELRSRWQLERNHQPDLQWPGGTVHHQGNQLVETQTGLAVPSRWSLSQEDKAAPSIPQPRANALNETMELPLSLIAERWTQLSVEVSGHPCLFLVDTGASNSVLDRQLARQLSLPRAGQQQLSSGLFRDMEWLSLGSLKVAGCETGPTRLLGLSLRQGKIGEVFPGIEGILGYDFLADYIVQFDYPQARLRLIPPAQFQPQPEDIPIECKRQGPGLSLSVTVGADTGQFTLDTGSAGGVLVQHLEHWSDLVPDRYRAFYDPEGVAFGSGKSGSWPGRGDVQVGPFRWPLAPLEVVNPQTAQGASLHSEGNIGVGFLRHFRVTVDLAGGRLWLAQRQPFATACRASYGLTLEHTSQGWTVKRAIGPAILAGLQPGDQILSLNGIAPQGLPTEAFLEQAQAGQRLAVRWRRQNQEQLVELVAVPID